ncbi:MAG: Ditrans,polycis-undecaprenyl-diphosphate synthase ((2E,6E)-farnesyl-diphosphate specific) [Holosporales bacterium]
MTKSIPQHIAIVMDGNGRWAKEKKLPLIAGHKKGANTAFEISKAAFNLGVSWLTLYTFSTENWRRPKEWISDFMGVLDWYLKNEIDQLIKNNVKLHIIGDIEAFSPNIQNAIHKAIESTKNNTGLNLVLALNYGARFEMVQGMKTLLSDCLKNPDLQNHLTEDVFSKYLYTKDIPDPDLVIRTSGEYRLSNFLLWQVAYSELAFSEKYWPDFTTEDFHAIIQSYQKRERRYGQYIGS